MKQMINKIFKNEKGSGLVLALMVLLVLSVLGSALGVVTVGSYRLGNVNQDSNSAYYIAEAGANMAYEEMEKKVLEVYENPTINELSYFVQIENYAKSKNDIDGLHGTTYNNFDSSNIGNPHAVIEIIGPLKNEVENIIGYIIKSTGNIGGKKRTVSKPVKVTWRNKKESRDDLLPKFPLGASVIVQNELYYKDGILKGDIYIDSNAKNTFVVEQSVWGIQIDNIFTEYSKPEVEDTDYKNIFDTPSWMLNDDSFNKNVIEKTSFKPLNIPWTFIQKYIKDLTIESEAWVDLESLPVINGTAEIKKNYKLTSLDLRNQNIEFLDIADNDIILVVDELKNHNGHSTDIIGDGTLTILVLEEASFEGGSKFNINSKGNLRILHYGQSNKIKINNNSQVSAQIISPKNQIVLEGGGSLIGSVISKSVRMDNGMSIQNYDFDFDDSLPSGDTEAEMENMNIISALPAVEDN